MLAPPKEEADESAGANGEQETAQDAKYVIKFSRGGSYQPGMRPHGIGKPLQGLTKVILEAR